MYFLTAYRFDSDGKWKICITKSGGGHVDKESGLLKNDLDEYEEICGKIYLTIIYQSLQYVQTYSSGWMFKTLLYNFKF